MLALDSEQCKWADCDDYDALTDKHHSMDTVSVGPTEPRVDMLAAVALGDLSASYGVALLSQWAAEPSTMSQNNSVDRCSLARDAVQLSAGCDSDFVERVLDGLRVVVRIAVQMS